MLGVIIKRLSGLGLPQEEASFRDAKVRIGVTTAGVLASILGIVTTNGAAASPGVWYVNQQATGANDGTSWQDAFLDLQDALGVASAGDEVWVAVGVYKPDRGTGDRMARFHLVDGAAIYGGFGGSETDCELRDWAANSTILSGDLNGDDGPADCALFTDCCRDHDGLGCDNPECEATVCALEPRCCVGEPPNPFDSWTYFDCPSLALHDCCNAGSRRSCENSYVVAEAVNTGPGTVLDGLVVKGSYISNANKPFLGGGLLALGANLSITNCTVGDNQDVGIYAWYGGSAVTLLNSTLENHLGAGVGGENTAFMVDGCAFLGNRVGLSSYSDSSGAVKNSVFRDNGTGLGFGGPLSLTNCEISNNGAGAFLESDPGRTDVVDCRFLHNGGALSIGSSIATVRDSTFIGNGPQFSVFYTSSSAVSVINTLFADNTPAFATFDLSFSRLTLRNCTIAGERLPSVFGAILWAHESPVDVVNTIFWDNQNVRGEGGQNVQFYLYGSTLDIDHSIVPGWTGSLGGVGNSGADPLFVDPVGPDGIVGTEDDDLRLSPGSPAINAGDPAYVPISGETDLDGHARILCGRVDIGGYEFGIGDYNCDQKVDLFDFSAWERCMTGPRATSILPGCEAFDFNADSDTDLLDFAEWQRLTIVP